MKNVSILLATLILIMPLASCYPETYISGSAVPLGSGGSDNITITGSGTAGNLAQWLVANELGDATNTDAQVAATVAASHTRSHAITSALDHTSGATPGQMLQADANGLPVDATNSNAVVNAAVVLAHAQNTDTSLGVQGVDLNMGGNDITNVGLVDGVDVSGHTHASGGANGGQLTSPLVNEAVALTATATNLNLVDDTNFIMELVRRTYGVFLPLPLYSNLTVTGSGAGWSIWGNNVISPGGTTGSTAYEYSVLPTLSNQTDWSKKHIWIFWVMTDDNFDASTIFRIQLKDTSQGIGALDDKGIGMELLNNVWNTESYGSARKSTSFSLTQTAWLQTKIMIVHDPTVPKIDFYKNDFVTPFYTETTSDKIPQSGTVSCVSVFCSVQNGAGTKNLFCTLPHSWYIEY
jgi:hypothetical protein